MKLFPILSSLLLVSSLSASELGTTSKKPEEAKTECGVSPRPIRLALRHIEGNGVGYNQGYTTLESFLTPIYPNKWVPLNEQWLPFADLRLHIFNNGEPAANAGLGMRYLTSRMVWGANAYYDYRKTTRGHYNQVALGFEGLGKIWDFRVNGYLPVGKTEFSKEHLGFEGHYLYYTKKREFALKGFNAEAGVHINEFKNKRIRDTFKNTPLYIAAGPYYLTGHGKTTWGAQARMSLDLCEYLRIEGNTSYDKIYHGIGQGQLTVMVPLGKRKKVYARKKESCQRALMWSDRALQRVDRNEIIPTKRKKKQTIAIDPATGDPYFFWFVNNTSHSLGTIESPFPTLLMAQNASSPNDVIYVFPGDGTDTGMSQGITLKDDQLLLSTSLAHSFATPNGVWTVGPMSTGMPQISNRTAASSQPAVILASNNELSGLSIHSYGNNGVTGGNGNVLIDNSVIVAANGNGVSLSGGSGLGAITIANSSVIGYLTGVSIGFSPSIGTLTISNSTLSGTQFGDSYSGLSVGFVNTVGGISVSNSTISGGDYGALIESISSLGTMEISNSQLSATLFNTLYFDGVNNQSTITISGNTISHGQQGILFFGCDTLGNVVISDNTITASRNGIDIAFCGGGGVVLTNNNITGEQIALLTQYNAGVNSITATGCTFTSSEFEAVSTYNSTAPIDFSFSNCTINGGEDGIKYINNTSLGNVSISNCDITAADGNGVDFINMTTMGAVMISGCQISSTSLGGMGISYDQINATAPTTITNCTISVPIGPRGVSFTNTPYNVPPPTQNFTLILQNDSLTLPLPAIGYYLDNPNASNNFYLQRQNSPGMNDVLTNITIIP